jgi:hypothetical protein
LELVSESETENLRQNTNNAFVWSDLGKIDDEKKTLTIVKKTGDKLVFDLNGNALNKSLLSPVVTGSPEPSQPPRPEEKSKRSWCFGLIMVWFLTISTLCRQRLSESES